MRWKIGFVFFLFLLGAANVKEIQKIDEQIQQLQDLQEKYHSRVRRNANNAMRWQFQNENYLDARRSWDQVAQDKQKIKELQDQIDDLKLRKQKIIQENDKSP